MSIGPLSREPPEGVPWPNHGIEKAPRRNAISKFKVIGDEQAHIEVPGERPHEVVQSLAHQDDRANLFLPLLQTGDALGLQLPLQNILKVLLAQEVQTVASDAREQSMENAGGKNAIGKIERGADQGVQHSRAAPRPALGKTLRVPGEVRNWTHRTEIHEAALDAPIRGRAHGARVAARRRRVLLGQGRVVSVRGSEL